MAEAVPVAFLHHKVSLCPLCPTPVLCGRTLLYAAEHASRVMLYLLEGSHHHSFISQELFSPKNIVLNDLLSFSCGCNNFYLSEDIMVVKFSYAFFYIALIGDPSLMFVFFR
jgi:hypothetical protein